MAWERKVSRKLRVRNKEDTVVNKTAKSPLLVLSSGL